jgi:uncharacterized protein YraI
MKRAILLLCLLLRFEHPVQSQSNTCETLVRDTIQIVTVSCADMGRNEACYGHALASALFQPNAESTMFESSGDIVSLDDLASLTTQPADSRVGTWGVALLRVQADLPDSTANAYLSFVLLGDAELTRIMPPTLSVTNTSGENIRLRTGPSQTLFISGIWAAGELAVADGRSEAGDWLRLSALGWVPTALIQVDGSVDSLEIVPTGSRPIPAFILETGTGGSCPQAPDGLLIQSPEGRHTHIIVNGFHFEFASAGYLTAERDKLFTIQGLDGEITVTTVGESITVSSGYQTSIPLEGLEAASPPTALVPSTGSNLPLDLLPALSATAGQRCAVTARSRVNIRQGPGTGYAVAGQLASGEMLEVDGQTAGADGYQWWRLGEGRWVRSDVVSTNNLCGSIPAAEIPVLPTINPITNTDVDLILTRPVRLKFAKNC